MGKQIKVAPNGELIEEDIHLISDPYTGVIGEYSDDNPVDNPSHYQSYKKNGIDCITAMQHAFGDEVVASFCKCNAMKYIWRESSKGGNESIQKAIWYLNKYLELNK
jgi:hypothetical protein